MYLRNSCSTDKISFHSALKGSLANLLPGFSGAGRNSLGVSLLPLIKDLGVLIYIHIYIYIYIYTYTHIVYTYKYIYIHV